jgi:hypothetical protein
VSEFTKSERRALRELAGEVYEAEAALLLEDLEASFTKWRAGELLPSELLNAIHEFHRDQSRQLWSMYQSLDETNIVARGLAQGLLEPTRVAPALRGKLKSLIEAFHP